MLGVPGTVTEYQITPTLNSLTLSVFILLISQLFAWGSTETAHPGFTGHLPGQRGGSGPDSSGGWQVMVAVSRDPSWVCWLKPLCVVPPCGLGCLVAWGHRCISQRRETGRALLPL